MDKKKQPGITLKSIMVTELSFKRAPIIPKKIDYDIEINTEAIFDKEKIVLNQLIRVKVNSMEKNAVEVACTIHGQFASIPSEINLNLEEFSRENAPAILYPFCREAIATISMKAGMPPILLPPFSFHAASKNVREVKSKKPTVLTDL